MRTGIAICTFNRLEALKETIARIHAHTRSDHELIVVDDGSSDGTYDAISESGVKIISARNRGIAWNKNRALFYLKNVMKSEAIILIEDDTFPLEDGWEESWIEAIARWGHVNLGARHWGKGFFRDGDGTPDRPYKSVHVSAQCSGFSSESLECVGYMDSRFRGWGMEHVEHTDRLIRAGFGGEPVNAGGQRIYYVIDSNLEILFREESAGLDDSRKKELIASSRQTCMEIGNDKIKRDPWINDEEMAIFLSDFNSLGASKICFYIKNDEGCQLGYDTVSRSIKFLSVQTLYGGDGVIPLISYYDGHNLKLCILRAEKLECISSDVIECDDIGGLAGSADLEFDVILDKNSGMYLSRNGLYLSCEKANGNVASINRREPNDWERFYFSHLKTIR